MHKKILSLFSLIFLIYFAFNYSPIPSAQAAISSCTVNITPTEIEENQTFYELSMSITNGDGANNIAWMKVTRPFDTVIIKGSGLGGWTKAITESSITFTGSTISPLSTISGSLVVNSTTANTGNWTFQVSDDTAGANPTNCTGTLSFAIAAAADTTAPTISSLAVSNVSSSSVTISWTTNESSTTKVEYNVTADEDVYPFNNNNTSLVTSHSASLTASIAANTTYYYRVCSTDASGNEGCSSENTFTTAAATTTTTTTTTTITAATATPTATSTSTTTRATATPFVDRVDPEVTITTDLSESFEETPLIEGEASDASSNLSSIEYSIDGGNNWLPVDDFSLVDGSLKSEVFSFTPNLSEDGNYSIIARATDSSGNIGESEEKTLIIDRLPPRVGGNLLYLGPHPLLPNENGVIVTMAGLAQKITLSAVGGPTSIDLLANERMFSLAHSPETGLWTGSIIFKNPGIYQLKTKAIDGAGNETNRDLNTVLVMRSGQITSEDDSPITEGKIKVYYQDQETESWTLWEGKSFGQENPQNIDENGNYEFFLPKGTYYIEVSSPGFTTLTTKIFKINEATPFNADFTLQKSKGVKIGPFIFAIPRIFIEQADVVIKSPSIPDSVARPLVVGEELPRISLPTQTSEFDTRSLRGDNNVLIFVSSWSPPAVEQISTLDDAIYNRRINAQFVTTQETPSKISIFLKRGNYLSEIAVDRDGETTEQFNINSLPTHFFINRTGVVEKVVTGVLNEEEVKNIISQIN